MADNKFTDSSVEILIEAVKEYPWLYDTKRKDFKDLLKRRNSWVDIGRLLDKSDLDCKAKWRYLRSKFSRMRHAESQASGSAANKRPIWHFYPSMTYFADYIINRKSAINNVTMSLEDGAGAGAEAVPEAEAEPEAVPEAATMEQSFSMEFLPLEADVEESHDGVPSPQVPRPTKRRSKAEMQQFLIDTLEESNKQLMTPTDEDYHFCMSMYKTIRTFERKERETIKLEMQNILCTHVNNEAEPEDATMEQSFSTEPLPLEADVEETHITKMRSSVAQTSRNATIADLFSLEN
ncbi:hypothetical protein GQR58_015402 [Nymphon striatum]|nr:hypothetical protein GQR58_015402 [Nymphon striatum]